MPEHDQAIVIVAKQPIAGQAKTRLCPPLSPAQAACLAHAFLTDAIATAALVANADVFLGFAPVSAVDWFHTTYPDIALLSQGEGDLGTRMTRLSAAVFSLGYSRVFLIGADTPFLSPERLEQALSAPASDRVVTLGPAFDGGYYLIGMAIPSPLLFENISWSGPTVLQETLIRILRTGMQAHFLPSERDIDTAEDLTWLSQNREFLGSSNTRSWLFSEPMLAIAESPS